MTYFLNKEEQAVLPSGGDFVPSGLVGPWLAKVVYKIATQEDIPDDLAPDAVRTKSSGWKDCYYNEYEQAKSALEAINSDFNPSTVWHFEIETASVMNFSNEEVREKFGATIGYDITVATLRSKKYRHEFHMIALPAAVAAYADSLGYENPGFDLSELTSQDTVFNDTTQYRLVGNGEAKAGDDDHYTNSILWDQRAKLWEALGEDDPRNYQLLTSDKKFATTSQKLSDCLGIVHFAWGQPAYVRLVSVSDPRAGADYNDKQLQLPTITDIFENKEEASKVVAEELERMAETSGGSSSGSASAPRLPVSWAEAEMTVQDWKGSLGAEKASLGDKPLTALVAKKVAEAVDATPADVEAWWDYV